MKTASFILFFLLMAVPASPALGARKSEVVIYSPGEMTRKDGVITATGTATKQVILTTDGYELSADAVRYDERNRTGQAKGNVRWLDRRTAMVREVGADSLSFDMTAKTAQAAGKVTVRERTTVLKADEAQVDLAHGQYQVRGQPAQAESGTDLITAARISYFSSPARVTAEENVTWQSGSAEERRTISAPRLEYGLTDRRGSAKGGVTAVSGEYLLTAENLDYDGGDVYTLTGQPVLAWRDFRLAADRISWRPAAGLATATGNAGFTGSGYTGSANEIRHAAGENQILLLGEARLVHGQDVMTGAEIAYDLKTGSARVTGPAKAVIYFEE